VKLLWLYCSSDKGGQKVEQLEEFLRQNISIDLLEMTLSGARSKDGPSKVKVRPIELKGILLYQSSIQHEKQVFHKNYEKNELIIEILHWLNNQYKQLQLETREVIGTVLVSKKKKVMIKVKKQTKTVGEVDHAHNRKKQYILEAGQPIPFLVDLGIMTKEGQITASKYDKFRQINRYLEFIEDVLPSLPRDRKLTIVDFGCGKSYLTFAMYYYLRIMKSYEVEIIGLDLKKDVIEHCKKLASQYQFESLSFQVGDIASFEGCQQVDMVVSLHACDTATDYAIEKAVKWGATVILSVPCCQHELNNQINCKELETILDYGLIKERMAALITDGIRAQLLESSGYKTAILEFIEMEHTPKNILIRAVKSGKKGKNKDKIQKCMDFLGVEPTLNKLLNTKGI
jgi:SAM-dependent methyltransferase